MTDMHITNPTWLIICDGCRTIKKIRGDISPADGVAMLERDRWNISPGLFADHNQHYCPNCKVKGSDTKEQRRDTR